MKLWKIILLAISLLVFFLFVQALISNLYFIGNETPNTQYRASELLAYLGSAFTCIGTVALGYITLHINQKATDISEKAAETSKRAAEVSEKNSVINQRVLEIEEERCKPKVDLILLSDVEFEELKPTYGNPIQFKAYNNLGVSTWDISNKRLKIVNLTDIYIYSIYMKSLKIYDCDENYSKFLISSCVSDSDLSHKVALHQNNHLLPREANIAYFDHGSIIKSNFIAAAQFYDFTFSLLCTTGTYEENISFYTFDIDKISNYSSKKIKVIKA